MRVPPADRGITPVTRSLLIVECQRRPRGSSSENISRRQFHSARRNGFIECGSGIAITKLQRKELTIRALPSDSHSPMQHATRKQAATRPHLRDVFYLRIVEFHLRGVGVGGTSTQTLVPCCESGNEAVVFSLFGKCRSKLSEYCTCIITRSCIRVPSRGSAPDRRKPLALRLYNAIRNNSAA